MEGTPKCGDRSVVVAQPRAAVQAGIVEGPDLAWPHARDDQARIADVVEHVIADAGDLLLETGHLPDGRPNSTNFLVVKCTGRVPLDGDVLLGRLAPGFFPENARNGRTVGVD